MHAQTCTPEPLDEYTFRLGEELHVLLSAGRELRESQIAHFEKPGCHAFATSKRGWNPKAKHALGIG